MEASGGSPGCSRTSTRPISPLAPSLHGIASQEPRGEPRVVEPGDPGQDERDDECPLRRSCRRTRPPRRARRGRRRPPVSRSSAVPGRALRARRRARARRGAGPRRAARARRSRHHPGCEDAFADEDDHHREHEQLVRHRIEQRPERRRPAAPPGEPAVEPVGCHCEREHCRRPVVVIGKVPDEEQHRRTARPRPAPGSAGRRSSRIGEYAGDEAVHQDSGRQPRRDHRSHLPHAPRAGDRVGRDLLGSRPRIAPRGVRGRGVSRRPRDACRELPEPGADHRRRAAVRRRGRSSRVRVPGRERRLRARRRGGRTRLDRPSAGGDGADGLQGRRSPDDERRGRPDHPRHDRARRDRRRRSPARRRDRLADRHQGLGRRRREGPQGRRLGGRGRARVRGRPPRRPGVLLRLGRLRRALSRRPASRRGAGARRRARHP